MCLLATEMQLVLHLGPPVHYLAMQGLLLSTEQGGFVRFTFLQVKISPFVRSYAAAAVVLPSFPTCLPLLLPNRAVGEAKRGLNLRTGQDTMREEVGERGV